MSSAIDRILCATILVVWGAVLCFLYFSGRVAAYLHPMFHFASVTTGVVLCVLAVAVLAVPAGEGAGVGHASLDRMSPGRRIFLFIVLVAPPLAALRASPQQYGASTVLNRGYIESIAEAPQLAAALPEPPLPGEKAAAADESSYLAKDENGRILAEVIDLIYAAEEPTMRPDFEGREVSLVGQMMPARENNPRGDRFNLIRMFMWCCAADSRPIALAIQAAPLPAYPEMTWIRVTGKATFPVESGRRAALVIADSVTQTDPPKEAFIY